jgi:hypothetical protein
MRIEQVTRYRCDGCATEVTSPIGWKNLRPLLTGTMTLAFGDSVGQDFCQTCVERMLTALRVTA